MALDIRRHPNVGYTTVGDVAIVLWTGDPTVVANRWLVDGLLSTFLASQPSCVVLVFIAPTSGVPDTQSRQMIQETFRTKLTSVRRLVNIPFGDSVKQTLFRTILRAMATLGDTKRVVSIAANIEEAIAAARAVALPETPSPIALRSAIHELFDVMGAAR